jgi:hypothetical protein
MNSSLLYVSKSLSPIIIGKKYATDINTFSLLTCFSILILKIIDSIFVQLRQLKGENEKNAMLLTTLLSR